MIKRVSILLVLPLLQSMAFAQQTLNGYWGADKIAPILEQTLDVYLDANVAHLNEAEISCLKTLISAGELFHQLYLQQKHVQAQSALKALEELDIEPQRQAELRQLFWMFRGPVATTLDNKREAFLPVSDEAPGRTVYPDDMTRATLDRFMGVDEHLRAQLLQERSVVRVSNATNLEQHRKTLTTWPLLAQLNPGFSERLKVIKVGKPEYYSVPYAIEYADTLNKIYTLLIEAADLIEKDDRAFAGYLRHRARDLLHSNYEAGDAAWVTGRFNNINAQIGSYETYDDSLYGAKAFYSMSILIRDQEKSAELARGLRFAQEIENSLPYQHHKTIKSDIPVHVSNVLADFGQARGTNTATILPNDPDHSKKYGRTILLRNNIMLSPALFEDAKLLFQSAIEPPFHKYLTIESGFQRTLWHEVGHYLGVDKTASGQHLGLALQQYADLLEEMKSDLVSLFAVKILHDRGVYSEQQLKAIYASGILRVLQLVKPRSNQPYQTMQLMQWNFFLENGVLAYNPATRRMAIDFDLYHDAVTKLLKNTLDVQYQGDLDVAAKFVQRYSNWKEPLHGVIANNMVGQATHRYHRVRYAILE